MLVSRRRLRPGDAGSARPWRCCPRPSPASSTPGRRSCSPAATTTRRSGSASPPSCWSAPGCTSAPGSTASARRCWSATPPSTPCPTSSRRPGRRPPRRRRAHPRRACCGPAMERVRADLARAAGPARSSWPTPSSPAARPASPSATSASAGSARCHPDVFAGVDYVALGHLHGRQADRDDGPLLRLARRAVVQRGRPHQGRPGWSTSSERTRAAVEPVEAPVLRPAGRAARHARGAARRPRAPRRPRRRGARSPSPTPIRPLGGDGAGARQRFPHTLVLRFEPAGVPVGRCAPTPRGSASATTSTCAATSSTTCAAGAGASEPERARAGRGGRGLAARPGRP